MPANLKCYTTEFPVLVTPVAKGLLELASHLREAEMYVIAPTKKAAADMLTQSRAMSGHYVPRELRLAHGSTIDCLTDAGLCGEPVIYLLPHMRRGPVVKASPGTEPVVIGRTERAEIAYHQVFLPA